MIDHYVPKMLHLRKENTYRKRRACVFCRDELDASAEHLFAWHKERKCKRVSVRMEISIP